jgi:chaperone required for assembly of F1-ATPase
MRDELIQDWFGDGEDPARYDPVRTARAAMKKQLPKRFYEVASVVPGEGGFALLLDGRPARTRLRHPLVAATEVSGALLAQEWAAQVDLIDPATMPVTRILHAAIDHVAGAMDEVRADILKYAGSDLICYRAPDPERLVALHAQHWDPVLAHIEQRHGARFRLAEGIAYVEQPAASLEVLRGVLAQVQCPQQLAALHVVTTITGSALIAITLLEGALEAEAAFAAGEVDVDFEVSIWGSDDEATDRRANRWQDFSAAAQLLAAGG